MEAGNPCKTLTNAPQLKSLWAIMHCFYYNTNGNNTVHFLNQVDEADLLALLSDEEKKAYLEEPQPTPTPEPTPIPTPVPTEKPSTEPDSSSIRGTVILVLFAVLGILRK